MKRIDDCKRILDGREDEKSVDEGSTKRIVEGGSGSSVSGA